MSSLPANINLLKDKNKNFIDKFIAWALTIGRVIVIVTEMIALGAFLYRFSLDRELIDLHDRTKRKEQIVRLLKPNEEKFRNLQKRLEVAGKFESESENLINTYQTLNALAPTDIVFGNVTTSPQKMKFDVNVQSVISLATFINRLKKNEKIASVSIDKIENKTSSATIIVSIGVTLKTKL